MRGVKDGKLERALQWWADPLHAAAIPEEHFDVLNGAKMIRFTEIDQYYELNPKGLEAMNDAGIRPYRSGAWGVRRASREVDPL